MVKQRLASRFQLVNVGVAALAAGLMVTGAMAQTSSMVVTETGNLGVGLDAPARQVHVQGNNAVFRMDRDTNSAAFLLVRTAPGDFGSIIKAFQVGANASGPNDGEFFISDQGTIAGGPGTRRLTISNAGTVTVQTLVQTSSMRYKSNVETLLGAEENLAKLRGVKFVRTENGREDVGLVAEEVAQVFPQLVERDSASGQVEAVNYSAMVAVLLEGYKAQSRKVAAQQAELATLKERMAALEKALGANPGLTLASHLQ